MKNAILLLFCLVTNIAVFAQQSPQKTLLDINYYKSELADALINKDKVHASVLKLIKDKNTAIKVAEAILFSRYGKEEIENERPYKTYLLDGYWVINGTLPTGMRGGTFLIILNSTNGEVIKLTHGK